MLSVRSGLHSDIAAHQKANAGNHLACSTAIRHSARSRTHVYSEVFVKKLCFTIALLCSAQAFSQSLPEVDLLFRHEIIPSRFVPLGTNVTIRLMVTNLSATQPAIADIFFLRSIPPDVEPYDVFNPSGQLGDCGPCIGSDLCVQTAVIPPLETRFCDEYFIAAQYAGIPVRIRSGVLHAQGTAIDPNPSNNIEQVTIGIFPPIPIQVSLSPLSYVFLGLFVLGLGGWASRRS